MIFNELYPQVNKDIEFYLNSLKKVPEPLLSAMKYSVLNGGKRLRPIMCFIGARLGEYEYDDMINVGISLEMLHCYSLVHDDMPCMDNDALRRGKPTTHIKFGQGMALLAGDALLNQAYELLSITSLINNNYAKSTAYIAEMAGSKGMIAGQCIDISEGAELTPEDILKMYSLKTSCLFKAALCGGAIAAGANAEEIVLLEEYADNLGIAFQIADDILDVLGNVEETGKELNRDKDKKTYVNLVGLDLATKHKNDYENRAKDIANQLKISNELNELLQLLINRKK